MAKIIFILTILAATLCHADSLEVLGGAVAYHPQETGLQYRNEIAKDVVTPFLAGLRYDFRDETRIYTSLSGFGGQDSFAQRIYGGAFSVGREWIGMIAGAYFRPTFKIMPNSNGEPNTMPFMGLETNLKLFRGLRFNSIVSFQLITGFLGIEL